MKNRIKRIILCVTIFCATVLPIFGGYNIYAAAQSVPELSGTEMNGAVLLTDENKHIPTQSYIIGDNKDYDTTTASTGYALKKNNKPTPFINFYVDTLGEGGSVYKDNDEYNGYNAYGFIAGSGEPIYRYNEETDKEELVGYNSVAININYNYSTDVDLDGTDGKKWSISNDSHKGSINGMDSVGVVGKGAVIVQKFVPTDEKQAPQNANDWQRLNEFSGSETDGLHTVNFFEEYSPAEKYQNPFPVYTPSGKNLQSGVYVKLTVAYELVHDDPYKNFFGVTKHSYTYKNVAEETVFYLCNTSGEVVFTNLYYESQEGEGTETEPTEEKAATTTQEQKGGAISNNQGAIDGFRADINGWNYEVTYRFNGSTNVFPCVDGQVFLEAGRYDFSIKTKLGMVRQKTVYIHEKTEEANLKAYFGDGLFSSDSMRVFMPSETYPVYVKGYTKLQTQDENASLIQRAPLVGRVYQVDDWDNIERDELGLPIGEPLDQKEARDHNWSFSRLSAGRYETVFANNEEFFNGTATGDTYKFVWRFTIIEEGISPIVNQENLYQHIGFSDYESRHYVAVLPSKGEGRILVAFVDEISAYEFACKYLASTVQVSDGKYSFDHSIYDTEAELLEKMHEKARTMVEKRYFDPTDVTTYVSLEEDVMKPVLGDNPTEEEQGVLDSYVDILNQALLHDVIVFSVESGREDFAIGEPFLNDRVYAYINSNGDIETERKSFKFISVADFESASVTLHPEGTELYYDIPYGVGMEDYLIGVGAPSGRYQIKESNAWGESEYYAVYIRPNDITAKITVGRLYNTNYSVLTRDKLNNGQHIKANSFTIMDITNQLDPYGLIKITKNGEEIVTCQIDEIDDLGAFDQIGNYEIVLIDRLGNSMTVYFDIHNAEKMYTLSCFDGNTEISSEIIYGGKEFTLPVLTSQDRKFEFYGWKDENGNLYTDTYILTKPQDVKLFAVWNYASVDISVYDGDRINVYNNKVGALQLLPDLKKEGYTLYGYRYELSDGTIRIYRNQISRVPNIERMRLDAMWTRNETVSESLEIGSGDTVKVSLIDGTLQDTLTIGKADVVSLPKLQDQDGMRFYGWLYEHKLSGMIFTEEFACVDLKDIGFENENAIKLTAVWLTISQSDSATTLSGAGTIGTNTFLNGLEVGSHKVGGLTGGFISILLTVLLAVVLVCGDKLRLGTYKAATHRTLSLNDAGKEKVVLKDIQQTKEPTRKYRKFKIRRLYKAVLVPCICLLLSATFLFDSGSNLIAAIAQEDSKNNDVTTSQVYDNALSVRGSQLDKALLNVQSSFSAVGSDEEELSESEEFLYSNILVDLLSMGYEDVFTAYAIAGTNTPETDDDKVVEGIGYTSYVDAYGTEEEHIFGAGFVSLAGENYITQEDVDNGVIIRVSEEEAVDYEYTDFKLTFNQTWGPLHYVAYENYVHYQVADYVVSYSIESDTGEYIDAYGDVYNYDKSEYCHYVNYGETFEFDAYGLSSEVDYDTLLQSFRESIEEQMRSAVDIDVAKADFISVQALNDYIVQGQDEKFLGVDAETLLYYEANIEDTQYYIIHEDGTVEVLNLPPDPAEKASIWERIWMGIATVAGAIVGVVACAIPGVGPVVGGAMISASIDLFMQTTVMGVPPKDIDWGSVLTSAIIGGVTGGIGQIGNAITKGAVTAAKTFVKKTLIKLGTEVVSGIVAGSATYLIGAGMREEELDWGDYFKAVGMGVVTGAIACLGGVAIEKIATKSNALFVTMQIVSGSLVSAAAYGLSLAVTGAEFSWEAFILATAMGAATATIIVVGGKIVKTIQTAQAKRLANSTKTTTYKNYQKREGGVTKYYDDDGNLYRVGNDLAPDSEYTMNGYKYKTDEQGRVIHAEGELYLKDGGRMPIKDTMKKIGKGYQKITDHRGHLIGDRFNGGNGLENIVLQDGKLNQGQYKALENEWAAALQSGKKVSVSIEVVYDEISLRPEGFAVEYRIDDGSLNKRFFEN